MRPRNKRPNPRRVGLILVLTVGWTLSARGDGGTLRVWRAHGRGEIAVFTQPTPLVTGPVDVSVLILDRDSGEPISGATVIVEVALVAHPERRTRHAATAQAATNKLMHAALFDLPDEGPRTVTVDIAWPGDQARVGFAIEVGGSWSARAGIWPWVLWPILPILAYGIHLRLLSRRDRQRRVRRPSPIGHEPPSTP